MVQPKKEMLNVRNILARNEASAYSNAAHQQHPSNPTSTECQRHCTNIPPNHPGKEGKVNLHRHIVRMFSSEDASCTSAVAIDNKIEQAMDLVKSHLMIAVREEVEVLKEKINELMDRINQLEVENTILKANASPEILTQLSATMQAATANLPRNTNTSNGPIS